MISKDIHHSEVKPALGNDINYGGGIRYITSHIMLGVDREIFLYFEFANWFLPRNNSFTGPNIIPSKK